MQINEQPKDKQERVLIISKRAQLATIAVPREMEMILITTRMCLENLKKLHTSGFFYLQKKWKYHRPILGRSSCGKDIVTIFVNT